MSDFLDDSEHMQALELPLHGGRREVQVFKQLSAPPAMDSELAGLQRSQKGLLARLEEVQTLGAGVGADTLP